MFMFFSVYLVGKKLSVGSRETNVGCRMSDVGSYSENVFSHLKVGLFTQLHFFVSFFPNLYC